MLLQVESNTFDFANRTIRRDFDEGPGNFYRQIQESLVLVTYASSKESGDTEHLRSLARAFANHTKKKGCRSSEGSAKSRKLGT